MSKLVNIHHKKPYDVYIGRPTKGQHWGFGNPFVVGVHAPRGEAIKLFQKWLETGESLGSSDATPERRSWILNNLESLKGKTLGCFCSPNPCHGSVLLKLLGDEPMVGPLITSFRGEHSFLSNFHTLKAPWLIPIKVGDDTMYATSSEAAYMACKTLNSAHRRMILNAQSAPEAKKLGRLVLLRPDWLSIKLDVMRACLKRKFADPDLAHKLILTKGSSLSEGNTWHDNYWGSCSCHSCRHKNKENNLGKLLEELRDSL